MPEIPKIESDDDPNRCQAVTAQGQCRNKAIVLPSGNYGTFCICHGGNKQVESEEKRDKRLYQLGKWQNQLEQQADHVNIKSLREEIGILRMVLQERFSVLKDTTDLILASGSITDLIMKIEKLVASCHKLEGSMGELLDKQAVLQFASSIISIISDEITDNDTVNRIADRIMAEMSNDKKDD